MMMPSNGQLTVPPGFRFHPTDEELLHYYLRKKVAYEAIDLDVIRDVDLNKLEPWDLKDKCRIGTSPQNEWYFFSHKDKKYPTGTRTNRATTAGFWKATGRDKAIHLSSSKRIGLRKTLVFYIGRAPHGQKTDWIMHEYRLDHEENFDIQEDGWVVCRVFQKKNLQRSTIPPEATIEEEQFASFNANVSNYNPMEQKQNFQMPFNLPFDTSMQLPQLLNPEQTLPPPMPMSSLDLECSQNLIKLNAGGRIGDRLLMPHHERFNGDWTILDKLLESHQNLDQQLLGKCKNIIPPSQLMDIGSSMQRLPLQYLGCDVADLFKFSN